MPTFRLTYGSLQYSVSRAVKGPDYIHGYAEDGNLIVAFEGVTDFSGFKYTGKYVSSEKCLEEACNTLKLLEGKMVRNDGSDVKYLAAGSTAYRSGSEYAADPTGKLYIVSEDCDLAKTCDAINSGTIVVGTNGLGNNYVQTTDGGFVPKSDVRTSKVIGTGAMAVGMGAIAFARASKSLGYRTQAGYPTSTEYLDERPELQVSTVKVLPDADGKVCSYTLYGEQDPSYTPGAEQGLILEAMALNYINELQFSIQEYSCIEPVHLRFVFANDCCDLSEFTSFLTSTATGPCSRSDYVPVPNGATKCSIYVVYTGSSMTDIMINDLTLTKYPHDNVGQAAVALGADTAALGNHAIAGGWRAIARGYNSLAIGSPDNTTDTATEASGYGAVAIGMAVTASGKRAFAFGENARATGYCAISMGRGILDSTGKLTKANTASAECAVAIGLGCTAASGCTFVYGRSNTATAAATNSFVGGSDSTANNVNAIVVGRYLKSGKGNQAVFGQYNKVSTNALLVVGKGTSDTARSNAFEVLLNGALVVGEGCYGDELPTTGVRGQLFFLKQ